MAKSQKKTSKKSAKRTNKSSRSHRRVPVGAADPIPVPAGIGQFEEVGYGDGFGDGPGDGLADLLGYLGESAEDTDPSAPQSVIDGSDGSVSAEQAADIMHSTCPNLVIEMSDTRLVRIMQFAFNNIYDGACDELESDIESLCAKAEAAGFVPVLMDYQGPDDDSAGLGWSYRYTEKGTGATVQGPFDCPFAGDPNMSDANNAIDAIESGVIDLADLGGPSEPDDSDDD